MYLIVFCHLHTPAVLTRIPINATRRNKTHQDSKTDYPHTDVSKQLASVRNDILNISKVAFESNLGVGLVKCDDVSLKEDVSQ